MNDDLERRLRDGLRHGALPAAPDGLRARLAGLPKEPRRSALGQFFTGLRVAGLASAAALAIAFVLVVRALTGLAGPGPGASLGSVATTGPSAAPTVSSATAVPSIAPPSPTSGFTCEDSATILPPTTSAVVPVTDVRVGSHPGYDRIVFEFKGSGRPQLTVTPASPPFVDDASGKPVTVPGEVFLTLKLYDASAFPTYVGPDSFSPNDLNLRALISTGDYEGYVSWVAGLNLSTCYRISTLAGPTRIVIDVQAP
jgi:hypothetical protein